MSARRAQPQQETPESYYKPILQKFPRLNNAKTRESYGVRTEIGNERPDHKSILSTKKLRIIQLKFIAELQKDVAINCLKGWVYKTQLASDLSKIQPMAEAEARA